MKTHKSDAAEAKPAEGKEKVQVGGCIGELDVARREDMVANNAKKPTLRQ